MLASRTSPSARFLVALVWALPACGGGSAESPQPEIAAEPAPPPRADEQEPVAQPAPAPTPAPPPAPPAGPRVDADAMLARLGGAEMVEPAPGLPALSEDGSHVAFAFVDGDGGRGNPNLAIRFFRTANGRKDGEVSILTADEAEGERTPALEQQIRTRATEAMAKITEGAYHSLRALVSFEGEQTGTVEGAAEGLKLTWNTESGEVVVLDEPGGAQRFRRRLRGARGNGPECRGLLDPVLRGAWVDPPTGVLVLANTFSGSDSCWEPADEITVARLRPAPRR